MNNIFLEKYHQFINKEISYDEAKSSVVQIMAEYYIKNEFEKVLACKAKEDLNVLFQLISWFNLEEKYLPDYHKLLLESWHFRHEWLIDVIMNHKNPLSIPYIVKALELNDINYIINHDTDYPSFVRKCMWALANIDTTESRNQLSTYLLSDNKVILKFADEQLRWLKGEKGMRYMG